MSHKMTLAIRDLVTNTIYQYYVTIDFSVSVIADTSKFCHTLPLMLFGIIFKGQVLKWLYASWNKPPFHETVELTLVNLAGR